MGRTVPSCDSSFKVTGTYVCKQMDLECLYQRLLGDEQIVRRMSSLGGGVEQILQEPLQRNRHSPVIQCLKTIQRNRFAEEPFDLRFVKRKNTWASWSSLKI